MSVYKKINLSGKLNLMGLIRGDISCARNSLLVNLSKKELIIKKLMFGNMSYLIDKIQYKLNEKDKDVRLWAHLDHARVCYVFSIDSVEGQELPLSYDELLYKYHEEVVNEIEEGIYSLILKNEVIIYSPTVH